MINQYLYNKLKNKFNQHINKIVFQKMENIFLNIFENNY